MGLHPQHLKSECLAAEAHDGSHPRKTAACWIMTYADSIQNLFLAHGLRFWHDFVPALIWFATALHRDGTKLSEGNLLTNTKWRWQDQRIARTLNSGRTRDDWKQLLKEIKIYFLPWNMWNKINLLDFISSHEKIHFWNASPVFKIFWTQTRLFFSI